MNNYKKLYMRLLEYNTAKYIPSEVSGESPAEIYHINKRPPGRNAKMDRVENIMALTKEEYKFYSGKKHFLKFLLRKHKSYLDKHNVRYERKYMDELINGNQCTKSTIQ